MRPLDSATFLEMHLTYLHLPRKDFTQLKRDLSLLPELWDGLNKIYLSKNSQRLYYLLTQKSPVHNSIFAKAVWGSVPLKSNYEEEPFLGTIYYLSAAKEMEEIYQTLENILFESFTGEPTIEKSFLDGIFPEFWEKNLQKSLERLAFDYKEFVGFYREAFYNDLIVIVCAE